MEGNGDDFMANAYSRSSFGRYIGHSLDEADGDPTGTTTDPGLPLMTVVLRFRVYVVKGGPWGWGVVMSVSVERLMACFSCDLITFVTLAASMACIFQSDAAIFHSDYNFLKAYMALMSNIEHCPTNCCESMALVLSLLSNI